MGCTPSRCEYRTCNAKNLRLLLCGAVAATVIEYSLLYKHWLEAQDSARSGERFTTVRSHLYRGCCLTGPPDELVVSARCASAPPNPWLVVRDPPAVPTSSDRRGYTDLLWEYDDLLLSAQAQSECPNSPQLMVVVRTEAGRHDQRNIIRRTWGHPGNYANCSFRVVFLMGALFKRKVIKALKAEFNLHKDIVVELKWRARLRTCTLVLAVEWVPSYALDVPLVLLVRDDTFVDVKAVMSALDWFLQSTGDMFGRVTLARDSRPQLEGCALLAKPRALVRLQPTFADQRLSCGAEEESLVTGQLARKAQLNIVHISNMGPCNPRAHVNDFRFQLGAMSGRLFTRTQVSITEMKKLYLQDLQFYHNYTARLGYKSKA